MTDNLESPVDILRQAHDSLSGTIGIVDNVHKRVHDGKAFIVSGGATLDNAGTQDFLLIVPAGVFPHIFFLVRGSGETNAILYEGTTVSANGTGAAEINRNRASANTAGLAVYTGPTVTGAGNALMTLHLGSGQQLGGDARSEEEFILNESTIYRFLITSEANGNDVSWVISWYEG